MGVSPWRRLGRNPLARRTLLRAAQWTVRGGRVLSGPAKGLRITLAGSNPGYLLGGSEPLVQAMVARLGPGDVFFDIGANIGFFSLIAARNGATVFAFEPHPVAADALRRNARRNNLDVTLLEVAVGDAIGEVRIGAGPHLTARIADEGIAAEIRRIDDLDVPSPTLIKIDVEGYEERVLLGCAATLLSARPLVVCEIHGSTYESCRSLLVSAGYDVRLDDDGGMPHLVGRPGELKR